MHVHNRAQAASSVDGVCFGIQASWGLGRAAVVAAAGLCQRTYSTQSKEGFYTHLSVKTANNYTYNYNLT